MISNVDNFVHCSISSSRSVLFFSIFVVAFLLVWNILFGETLVIRHTVLFTYTVSMVLLIMRNNKVEFCNGEKISASLYA